MGIEIKNIKIYTEPACWWSSCSDTRQRRSGVYGESYMKNIKWGIKINISKTKYLCVGGPSSTIELEHEEQISNCNDYNALPRCDYKLRFEDTKEIKNRITQGKIAIKRLNRIW